MYSPNRDSLNITKVDVAIVVGTGFIAYRYGAKGLLIEGAVVAGLVMAMPAIVLAGFMTGG